MKVSQSCLTLYNPKDYTPKGLYRPWNSPGQNTGAVIVKPPKIKSDTVSTVSPSISHEMMEPDAMILVF